MSEEILEIGLANGTIKRCPYCGIGSELISGCNFVTCVCSAQSHWCFKCGKRKGASADECPYGSPCNSH